MGAARKIQLARYAELGLDGVVCNAGAPASLVEEIANADAPGWRFCATPPTDCVSPRVAIIGCSSSPARSPIWTVVARPAGRISPRRSLTEARPIARPRPPDGWNWRRRIKFGRIPQRNRNCRLKPWIAWPIGAEPGYAGSLMDLSAGLADFATYALWLQAGAMIALAVALATAVARARGQAGSTRRGDFR